MKFRFSCCSILRFDFRVLWVRAFPASSLIAAALVTTCFCFNSRACPLRSSLKFFSSTWEFNIRLFSSWAYAYHFYSEARRNSVSTRQQVAQNATFIRMSHRPATENESMAHYFRFLCNLKCWLWGNNAHIRHNLDVRAEIQCSRR